MELTCLLPKSGAIEVELRAYHPSSLCPSCGHRSSRVHSRYWRVIADLPWEGIPVRILLQARKFFYGNDRCSRRIFTEQLPTTVARYARRSCRLVRLSAVSGGRKIGGCDCDQHPARRRRGGAGQRGERSHAPEELRDRRPAPEDGIGELVSHRIEASGQRCRYESSPKAAGQFEEKFTEMWSRAGNSTVTAPGL